jgi:glycosyltransferase involved in cell wall biosynthesis
MRTAGKTIHRLFSQSAHVMNMPAILSRPLVLPADRPIRAEAGSLEHSSDGAANADFALAKLKLCFLAGTLEHGGAERQLFYILQALGQAGAKLRLLSLDRGKIWEERIRQLGVRVDCVGDAPSRWKRVLRICQELRKEPAEILQSQHFFANVYVGVVARLMGVAGIGAMRNKGSSEVAACGRFGGWLSLHLPATLAANSQMAIRYAVAQGVPESRLYFLPNVVDTDKFRPAATPAAGPLTLITVGRLVKQKRLDRFLAVLGRLHTELRLNVRGLIVGPSREHEDLRPALEQQARSLGLTPDRLEFRGGVSDMRPVYHEAGVCVLTSDFEGTPNVLLEAMASGLPVVATNVGGVAGIVRHRQTGFLLEPDDLAGMVAALAELARTPECRSGMGRRAREFVQHHHSLQRLPSYLSGLYPLALAHPRRAPIPGLAPASN